MEQRSTLLIITTTQMIVKTSQVIGFHKEVIIFTKPKLEDLQVLEAIITQKEILAMEKLPRFSIFFVAQSTLKMKFTD